MVNKLINSKEIMIRLIEHAFSNEKGLFQADAEYLQMLASGRYNEIPKSERQRLLSVIASNPDDSALLSNLLQLEQDQKSILQKASLCRTMTLAWGIAACLMIGLFVSRVIDHPDKEWKRQPIFPYAAQNESDYWTQLDKKRLFLQYQWYFYRDIALFASTASCLMLSAALIVLLRKNKNNEKTHDKC